MQLDSLLSIESSSDLWTEHVDGIRLWPLIRTTVLSMRSEKDKGYSPGFASGRMVVPPPAYVWEELRALYGLHTGSDPYDAVFFTSAVLRTDSDSGPVDRLLQPYFSRFKNPLIFQDSYRGSFYRSDAFSNSTFLGDALRHMTALKARFVPLPASTHEKVAAFSRTVAEAFDLADTEGEWSNAMVRLLKMREPLEQFVRNHLAPRVPSRLVFMNEACFLGWYGLLTTCFKENGFTVIEPQHGFVSFEHPAYNYPNLPRDGRTEIQGYFPDYLLTFGPYWSAHVRVPVDTVAVGYPYLNREAERLAACVPDENVILFVSQGSVTERLAACAAAVSKAFPEVTVVFKLHPGEVPFTERYAVLSSLANVRVVTSGSVHEWLSKSRTLVGAFSTVLFESVLFPNRRVFVLTGSEDLPACLGASFSSADDLIRLLSDPRSGQSTCRPREYWTADWEVRFSDWMSKRKIGPKATAGR